MILPFFFPPSSFRATGDSIILILITIIITLIQKSQYSMTHPKAQAELAYWREREEESRKKISSASATHQGR